MVPYNFLPCKQKLSRLEAKWLARNNSELSLLYGTSLQPTDINLPYRTNKYVHRTAVAIYIFLKSEILNRSKNPSIAQLVERETVED